jgi:hypothetical protein
MRLRNAALGLLLGGTALAAVPHAARAASVTSSIPVVGNFQSGIGVTGNAQLHSASGTFKQWLLFTHANIGVSASPQTVGVSLTSSPNLNVNGSGTVGMTYDDVSPGTPQTIDSVNIDINGAGGSNTPINFDLSVSNLNINTSLGTFQLQLSVDAAITDLVFGSTGATSVIGGNGGLYASPGNLAATLNGIVTGKLVNVPILGTINLGTLYNIVNAPLAFAVPLPGIATTSDPEPTTNPDPHDMIADFSLSVTGLSIPFPFAVPIDIAMSQSVPNGQSGFSVLNVDADLNAQITLSDPQYLYTGTVPNVLVPEPSVALLVALGLAGLGVHARRT